ncbi:MAG: hypothetical protein V7697_29445 [Rhodococcus erythropolis]
MSSIDEIVKQVVSGEMSADAAASAIRQLPKITSDSEFDSVQNYYNNPDGRSSHDDIGIVMAKLSDSDYEKLYNAIAGE